MSARTQKAAPVHNPFDSSDDESAPSSNRASSRNPFDDVRGVHPQERTTNPFDDEPETNPFAHQSISTNPFDGEEQPKRAAVAANPRRTQKLSASDRKDKDLNYASGNSSSNPFDDGEQIPLKPASGIHRPVPRENRTSAGKQSNVGIRAEAYDSGSLESDPREYQSKRKEEDKLEEKAVTKDSSNRTHHLHVKEKLSSISDGVANRVHRLKQGSSGQFKDTNVSSGIVKDSEKSKRSGVGSGVGGSTARNLLFEGDQGKRQHVYPGTQGASRFEETRVGMSGLDGKSVQELESYALHKSEETTSTIYNCLRIAEDTKEVAVKTTIQLHEQGEQIRRTHDTAVEVDLELRKGEKLLGSLGGLFSHTWKPKKTKIISGPNIRSDSFKRKAYGLDQRAALGLTPGNARGKFHRSSVADMSLSQNETLLKVEKAKQDDAFSDLSNVLGQLKDMTLDMGKEIERQNEDLDNLHGDVTELGFRVKGANDRGRRLLGR